MRLNLCINDNLELEMGKDKIAWAEIANILKECRWNNITLIILHRTKPKNIKNNYTKCDN